MELIPGLLVMAIGLGLLACTYAFLQTRNVLQLTKKLRDLNAEQRTEHLATLLPSKSNYELVMEINRFIEAQELTSQQYRVKELRLQQALSNISHDMRTPLTAILGYLRLLENPDLPEQERQAYVAIVRERARALQRLILDFYDLSRLDEESYQFLLESVDVNKLCRELLAQAYDDFEAAGMTVTSELLPSAPSVIADEGALARIMSNLLQNARQHGQENLKVSSSLEDQWLVMTFSNGSEPVDEQELKKLFERSYTLSKSRDKGGTGLGLTICRALIENMGHEIQASYQNGCFTIELHFGITGGTRL
jgi:signal transduction histidine kinase